MALKFLETFLFLKRIISLLHEDLPVTVFDAQRFPNCCAAFKADKADLI